MNYDFDYCRNLELMADGFNLLTVDMPGIRLVLMVGIIKKLLANRAY